MLEILIPTLLGIFVTIYVAYLQMQRGRVNVDVEIENEDFDARRTRTVFWNSSGTRAIDVTVTVRSRYNLPLTIEAVVIGVPKLISLSRPSWLIKAWPVVDNMPLKNLINTPVLLPPGEELQEAYTPGLPVGQSLESRNYVGRQVVMLGVIDEKKNVYYSDPFELVVEEWLQDRGQWLIA